MLHFRFAAPLLAVLLAASGLVSCGTSKKTQPADSAPVVAVSFNADSAYAFCAMQCQFGPRPMNTPAHDQCGQWIEQQFRRLGCDVTLQQATLRGYDGTPLRATNIMAATAPKVLPGAATSGAGDVPRVLLCAHWDSRPWADNDPDSANWHKPILAANDAASGVAVMLELARLIQQADTLPVAVDFVCFDAEDWGTPQWSDASDADSWALGAQYWAAHHESPAYQYAILLDMVGGQGARFYQEGFSLHHARPVVERVWRAAAVAGYASFFPTEPGGYITDDHVPVNEEAHIPCIDIIPYYPDYAASSFGPTWHTLSDDLQHIDRNTLKAVGQTLVQLLFSR